MHEQENKMGAKHSGRTSLGPAHRPHFVCDLFECILCLALAKC